MILISSVEISDELPKTYLTIGKTGILNLIPDAFIKPPSFISGFLFGAINKDLLKKIIRDTDPLFIRWALDKIVTWKGSSNTIKPIRIHGTRDRLIPLKGDAIKIKDGGHFMIVDKANEISTTVNKVINS